MDIQKSFTFVFEDDGWQRKGAIGAVLALLSFLVLPALILVGYSIEVARNVRDGRKTPLPDWNYGSMLREGFMVSLAGFVYTLPAILLFVLGGGGAAVLSAIGGGESGFLNTAGGGIAILLSCIALLYLLAFLVVAPAIYIQYIRHGNLAACFQFSEVINIARSQLGNIIMTVIVIAVAGFAFSIVSGILNVIPCLGQLAWLVLTLLYVPYQQAVTGHLYGQIAANIDGKKTNFDEFDNLDFS